MLAMQSTAPADLRILAPRSQLTGTADALGNLLVDEVPDGALCFVVGVGLYQLDKDSVAAVSSPTVIATGRGSGVPGRWVQFSGTVSVNPPLRNTLYVDPNSTVTPETGSILAPYVSLQDAVDAVAADVSGTEWLITIPPGIDIAESLTIPGQILLEIGCDAIGAGLITGNIDWDAAGSGTSFFGLRNVVLTGNLGGTGADAGIKTCIIDTCIITGTVTFGGLGNVAVYTQGASTLSVLALGDGFAISRVEGALSTTGALLASSTQFLGNITAQTATLENSFVGIQAGAPIAVSLSGTLLKLIDTPSNVLNTVTFSGAAGTVQLDGQSSYYWNLSTPTLTNGSLVLLDSDVKFGGILPDSSSNIDPTLGSLFYVNDITAPRTYTAISAGAAVNDTLTVECRNTTVNVPTLRNGGTTPADLVAMVNGFGYVITYDGSDWVWTSRFRLNQ